MEGMCFYHIVNDVLEIKQQFRDISSCAVNQSGEEHNQLNTLMAILQITGLVMHCNQGKIPPVIIAFQTGIYANLKHRNRHGY